MVTDAELEGMIKTLEGMGYRTKEQASLMNLNEQRDRIQSIAMKKFSEVETCVFVVSNQVHLHAEKQGKNGEKSFRKLVKSLKFDTPVLNCEKDIFRVNFQL